MKTAGNTRCSDNQAPTKKWQAPPVMKMKHHRRSRHGVHGVIAGKRCIRFMRQDIPDIPVRDKGPFPLPEPSQHEGNRRAEGYGSNAVQQPVATLQPLLPRTWAAPLHQPVQDIQPVPEFSDTGDDPEQLRMMLKNLLCQQTDCPIHKKPPPSHMTLFDFIIVYPGRNLQGYGAALFQQGNPSG